MKTPTQTYEDFAIEMVESYRCCAFSEDAKECAIIECKRHILYAEDTEYFEEAENACIDKLLELIAKQQDK